MKPDIALVYFKQARKGSVGEITLSLEREVLEQVCVQRGWTPEWYERGKRGWEALTAQVERPEVAAVVAYSLPRLNRDRGTLAHFLSKCCFYHVTVVTVFEGVDTSDDRWRGIVNGLEQPGMFFGRRLPWRHPASR
jgi:DNA invertase Pin-like site-specific DNA recombinase